MDKCFSCETKKDLIKIQVGNTKYMICDNDSCRDHLCEILFEKMDEIRKAKRPTKKLKSKKEKPKAENIKKSKLEKKNQKSTKAKKKSGKKGSVMNKPMQVAIIRRIIGEDNDKVDVEAHVDSTLHLDENLNNLRSKGLVRANDNVNAQYDQFKRDYKEHYGFEFKEMKL